MSFLNSVLSSIGGNGAPISTPPAPVVKSLSTDKGPLTSQAQNGANPGVVSTPQNNKRKAEDALAGPESKNIRNSILGGQAARAVPPTDPRLSKPANTSSTLSSKLTASIGLNSSKFPDSPSTLSSGPDIPYRGTSRPSQATVAFPAPGNPAAPATPAGGAAKAPKKGSYAEIMARAKATQSKAPAVGVISHKPKDQQPISYKKELKMKKKALKNRKLGIKTSDRPSSSGSRSSSPAPGTSDPQRHPYKGTAKTPKPQPTYKGTMALSSTAAPKPSRVKPKQTRYDEYAATDEDDLDDIEEDEYGYEEDSDDMEAGFSDVEQEESAAARTARKEDEEEARLEAKLKVEKEERKKRLAEMARKAKPQKY